METAVAAPPTPAEMNEPSAPAQPVPQPAPQPTPQPTPEPVLEPVQSKPPVDVAERVDKAKKSEPKAIDPATDPAADETPVPASETKPATDAAKPAASETKAAPTAKQIDEEELTAEEVAKIGKMTPKELRTVFAARNKAERKLTKVEKENEQLTKEVKRIATLEATIKELEKRPTTEANDARIAAAEKELATRKAELDAQDTTMKDREESVRLREYATEVTKTADYKKFVAEPRDRMFATLARVCRGAAEDEDGAKKLYGQMVDALASGDEAVRWRQVRKVVDGLNNADVSALTKIYDEFNLVLANDKQLNENAEVAKKTVDENRTREAQEKSKLTKTRFQMGIEAVRPQLEAAVPFMKMDLSKNPEYKKLRDEAIANRDAFDVEKATPEEIASLNEMAYTFQLAAVVSQGYQKQLEDQKADLQAKFDEQHKELEALKAEKDGKKAEEDKEEEDADEVTPTVGNGNAGRLETFHPGASLGKASSFMEAVNSAPDK